MKQTETKARRVLDANDVLRAIEAVRSAFGSRQVCVVGSAALALSHPGCHPSLRKTGDVDLWTQDRDDLETHVNWSYGPKSEFAKTHGFTINGVGKWTLLNAPDGWRERLTSYTTPSGVRISALSLQDVFWMKVRLNRLTDGTWAMNMFAHGGVSLEQASAWINESGADTLIRGEMIKRARYYHGLRALAEAEEMGQPTREGWRAEARQR